MTLEIGESLFYSWLRHIKNCQIVQTNWKPSGNYNLESPELEARRNEVVKLYEHLNTINEFQHIFPIKDKGGLSKRINQILRQTEIDVVGIHTEQRCSEQINQFYSVDVAFHRRGLNYGANGKTIDKIISKLARTAFCLYTYMGTKKASLYFASPKSQKGLHDSLNPLIEQIEKQFDEFGFEFSFRVIFDDDFKEQIIDEIIYRVDIIDDMSDLFIRSMQLYFLFEDTPNYNYDKTANDNNKTDQDKTDDVPLLDDSWSLQFCKVIHDKIKYLQLSNDDIAMLTDKDKSKDMFKIGWSFLTPDRKASGCERRYYAQPVSFHGKEYYICNHWTKKNKPYLRQWVEEIQKRK